MPNLTRFFIALLLLIAAFQVNCNENDKDEPVCKAVGKSCMGKTDKCCGDLTCHGLFWWVCKECIPAGEKCSTDLVENNEKPCCKHTSCEKDNDTEEYKCKPRVKARRSLGDFFSD